MGLDLSARVDLSAAVLAARDEQGYVHLLPFIFTPLSGLKERGQQNRAPFELWVEQGYLIAVPGSTISYDWVCEFMRQKLTELELNVDILAFDRWRIKEFRLAADRAEFAQGANWIEVGQGYKDQGPRLEAFENEILDGKIRHGNHPLLNFAAASAIVVKDPAGNMKIDKARVAGAGKIDALVASVMAAHPVTEGREGLFSIGSMIA
jgi:phage terminase large subunit-like protein